MARTLDWRRYDIADDLKHIHKPGFAWEFLRRNRGYRRDYNRITRRTAAGSPDNATAATQFLRRWGLICPLRSECGRKPGTDSVAPGIPPDLRPHRRRTP